MATNTKKTSGESDADMATGIIYFAKLAIPMFALLVFGGQKLWTCVSNLSQTVIPYSTFKQQGTSAKWVKLRDCQIDSMNMSWRMREKSDRIYETLVPLRLPGEDPSEPIHALLAMEDPVAIDLAERLRVASSELEMKNYTMIRKLPWNERRDVDGLIRYGFDMTDSDLAAIKRGIPNLAPDFVIIDNNETPNFWLGAVLFGAGLFLVLPFILLFYRWIFPGGSGPQRMEMPAQ